MSLVVIAHTVKNLLNETGSGKNGAIDTILMDATLREVHTLDSVPVEHPVEPDAGGSIIDHVHLKPEQVTLECAITNTPVTDPPSHGNEATAQPLIVTPFSSLQDNPGEVRSNRLGAADPTLGLRGQISLPPTVGVFKGFIPEFNRVEAVWEELEAIRNAKKRVSITTSLKVYDNMVLTLITAPVERRGSLTFTVTARKFETVEAATAEATELVTSPTKLGKKATKTAAPEDADRARKAVRKKSFLAKQFN